MKKRVLIVDDEEDTLKLLKIIVELSGYEAYTTLNSLDALMMAQVEQPDVVLLDIMMPKLDGFQLCKMMRAHPKTRALPVIFVTAYSALDLEDRKAEAGGDLIVPKPVGMDQLIEAIEHVQTLPRHMPDDLQKAAADITLARNPFKDRPDLLQNAAVNILKKTEPLKSANTDTTADNPPKAPVEFEIKSEPPKTAQDGDSASPQA